MPAPITSLTLNAVIAAQRGYTRRFGSSASGRYQFMRATLLGLKREMSLSGFERFDPDLQDLLAYQLLKRRGYAEFASGRMGRTEFGKRLAQEWASFPVLDDTRGAKRAVRRGQSYYAGDGRNKALVSAAAVEKVLERVARAATSQDAAKAPDRETGTAETGGAIGTAKTGGATGTFAALIDFLLSLFGKA